MLPAAASFKKQGANKGALASFLVSTPESGVDSIAITYALLGPIMAVARPLAAFVSGISAGFLENFISSKPSNYEDKVHMAPAEFPSEPPTSQGFTARIVSGIKYGFGEVWGDIVFWFFIGLFLAGVITVLIPEELFEKVLGGGLLSMLIMLLIGMPIYICATASTPIAAALLLKGASPGAVLVFLLAGPATNMTSLSVLTRILGNMGTVRYLLVIAIVSVLFGLGLDGIYLFFNITPQAVVADTHELVPYWLKLGSAGVLLLLSARHVLQRYLTSRLQTTKNQFIVDFPEIGSITAKGSKIQTAPAKVRKNVEK